MELKKSSEVRRQVGRPGVQLPPPPPHNYQCGGVGGGGGERLQLFILLRAPSGAFSGKELRSPAAPQGGALLQAASAIANYRSNRKKNNSGVFIH